MNPAGVSAAYYFVWHRDGDDTNPGRAADRYASDEDARITAQIRVGDRSAFRTAFDAHYTVLHRFATYRTGSADAAEDVVQEVFAALWEGRAGLVITSSLRAYLIRAVRNRTFNRARHEATVRNAIDVAQAEGASFAMGSATPSPELATARSELRDRMMTALASLPPRQREVMLLRWREELAPREIAEALGIAEQVVRRQLAAGAEKLRRAFTRDDFR